MKELLKNINENYNIHIEKIEKLGETTINDIFVIDGGKKYVVKIYNVDEERQVKNSLKVQKKISELLGIAADVLLNKEQKTYTEYNDKFYAIQEYIKIVSIFLGKLYKKYNYPQKFC